MKNYLVLYYSKTGNSKFIAEKLASEIKCDILRIKPMIDNVLILFLLSLFKIKIPTNISIHDFSKYDEVIILGPIWGGQLVSPLRTVLQLSVKTLKNTHFAVTCETKEQDKETKYGYNQVLKIASEMSNQYVKCTEGFSTSLVNFSNKPFSVKLSEKIKITEENYQGILKDKVGNFALKIKSA